ncbi:hypothetical protein TRFO_27191 [Tritrichomonas foetus]|uniref:Uncharacterized protein n=1 Tax=Tritrichomonas foetus TaxID=1144522 RepID=A0A1J4K176_9EUKA|nr:hypothetical protein TRFO_27191 [Tritrichomonas foetus]|eukprot:OHT05177.1 hypothetical protein TRFO_27191 [Tritrichomonas foetus]
MKGTIPSVHIVKPNIKKGKVIFTSEPAPATVHRPHVKQATLLQPMPPLSNSHSDDYNCAKFSLAPGQNALNLLELMEPGDMEPTPPTPPTPTPTTLTPTSISKSLQITKDVPIVSLHQMNKRQERMNYQQQKEHDQLQQMNDQQQQQQQQQQMNDQQQQQMNDQQQQPVNQQPVNQQQMRVRNSVKLLKRVKSCPTLVNYYRKDPHSIEMGEFLLNNRMLEEYKKNIRLLPVSIITKFLLYLREHLKMAIYRNDTDSAVKFKKLSLKIQQILDQTMRGQHLQKQKERERKNPSDNSIKETTVPPLKGLPSSFDSEEEILEKFLFNGEELVKRLDPHCSPEENRCFLIEYMEYFIKEYIRNTEIFRQIIYQKRDSNLNNIRHLYIHRGFLLHNADANDPLLRLGDTSALDEMLFNALLGTPFPTTSRNIPRYLDKKMRNRLDDQYFDFHEERRRTIGFTDYQVRQFCYIRYYQTFVLFRRWQRIISNFEKENGLKPIKLEFNYNVQIPDDLEKGVYPTAYGMRIIKHPSVCSPIIPEFQVMEDVDNRHKTEDREFDKPPCTDHRVLIWHHKTTLKPGDDAPYWSPRPRCSERCAPEPLDNHQKYLIFSDDEECSNIDFDIDPRILSQQFMEREFELEQEKNGI